MWRYAITGAFLIGRIAGFDGMNILAATHPPRLAGFDREAQPWRVFYA